MRILTDRERDLNEQIASFLRERPFISVSQLEISLGISKGAISRAVSNKYHIPPKHLHKIIYALAIYGIKIDGYYALRNPSGGIDFVEIGNVIYSLKID